MTLPFTCPRREETPAHFNHASDPDDFRDDDTCSYCGSLNPDTLMARLEAGDVTVVPTDKSYKAYVRNAGGADFKASEQKFYFQHLSEAQKKRFVDLLNERKIALAYPHRFYVLPFFIERQPLTGGG